jgi:nucleoid-associated protein YgaU
MKRTFSFFIVTAFVLVAFSCASTQPAPQPAPPPVPQPAPTAEPAPQPAAPRPVTVEQVYEQHSGDLILEGAKSYTVKRADTLSKITRNNYGGKNGYYFPLIMLASQNVVKDPDLIIPGMKLTIPDLQKNLDDPGARQKIREVLNDIAGVYNTKGHIVTRDRLRTLAASL